MILNVLATTAGLILAAKLISLPFLIVGRAAYNLSTLVALAYGTVMFTVKYPADGIGVLIFMSIILATLFLIGRAAIDAGVAPPNANDRGGKFL